MREGTEVLTQGAELEGGEESCHSLHQEGARLGQTSLLAVSLENLVMGGGQPRC